MHAKTRRGKIDNIHKRIFALVPKNTNTRGSGERSKGLGTQSIRLCFVSTLVWEPDRDVTETVSYFQNPSIMVEREQLISRAMVEGTAGVS